MNFEVLMNELANVGLTILFVVIAGVVISWVGGKI